MCVFSCCVVYSVRKKKGQILGAGAALHDIDSRDQNHNTRTDGHGQVGKAAANGGKAQQDGESILSRFLSCFTASTEESGSGFPYLPVAIGAGVVILIAGVYVVKRRSCS